ncbi:hypothetical protein [uncultured Nitratireductor sp.]|uniref:hypothetical protein n=1 Tax=uncultured Nitratireductor sp. TaxID=520953 RepID=UPI0025CCA637|nr:hypothetical protein [uncultured Nitratireductor sp.]
MNRNFISLLSVYWTVAFAAAAWSVAISGGVAVPTGSTAGDPEILRLLGHLGLVLGNALVAVLFAWMLLVSLLEAGNRTETENVAQLACSGAVAMLLVEVLRTGMAGNGAIVAPSVATTMKFLAVLATHLVLRGERGAMAAEPPHDAHAQSGSLATLTVADQAHDSLVARLARPHRLQIAPPANDDRSP